MQFVSVTRLKLRAIWKFFAFRKANEASIKALQQSDGLVEAHELMDKGLTFWTLTVWDSQEAMMHFRNSPAHREAMRNLPDWCEEASYHHWVSNADEQINWPIASSRLLNEGKLSKVRNPSKNQTQGVFPPMRWTKTNRVLKKRK